MEISEKLGAQTILLNFPPAMSVGPLPMVYGSVKCRHLLIIPFTSIYMHTGIIPLCECAYIYIYPYKYLYLF